MTTSEDAQVHFHAHIHRVRLWCDAHGVQKVADINWYRLWDDVARDNKWSDLHEPMKSTFEVAHRQAKEAFEKGLELFPKGWDKNPQRL